MGRKVDVSKMDSPASTQLWEEMECPGIPFIRVYDADGNFVGQGHNTQPVEEALKLP